jgi:DNA adenine methylase
MAQWSPNSETYYAVRALDPTQLTEIGRAARFVYLNRLCFNGVYRTNRAGEFNVPFGRNTGRLPGPAAFEACAEALRGAALRDGDFTMTTADATPGDVVYLDPPYTQHPQAAYGVYGYGAFQATDVARLVSHMDRLADCGVKVVLSYADTTSLRALLDDRWRVSSVESFSHVAARAQSRVRRSEVLVTNGFLTPHGDAVL